MMRVLCQALSVLALACSCKYARLVKDAKISID